MSTFILDKFVFFPKSKGNLVLRAVQKYEKYAHCLLSLNEKKNKDQKLTKKLKNCTHLYNNYTRP